MVVVYTCTYQTGTWTSLGKMTFHLTAGYSTQNWHLWVTGNCTLLSFTNISFKVVPLCTGLISAWFSQAGSKHSLTLPLALGTTTKLLHHSDTSSTPKGVFISCHCSLSSSSWNGFCNTYATCRGSTCNGLLFVFSCKENVPLKHPMPLKTSSSSLCICYVDSAPFLLSLSQLGPAVK